VFFIKATRHVVDEWRIKIGLDCLETSDTNREERGGRRRRGKKIHSAVKENTRKSMRIATLSETESARERV